MVTIFEKGLAAAASNVIFIFPVSPGLTGVLVYSGTVHPQVDSILLIIKGSDPVLVKVNSSLTGVPCGMLPQSWVSCLNLKSAASCALIDEQLSKEPAIK